MILDGNKVGCNTVLQATGCKGKVNGLILDAAGVHTEGSFVVVYVSCFWT